MADRIGWDATSAVELEITRGARKFEFVSGDREAMHFIAVASNGRLPQNLSCSHHLIDTSDQRLKQNYGEIRELLNTKKAIEKGIAWLQAQFADRGARVESLSQSVKALTEGGEWC